MQEHALFLCLCLALSAFALWGTPQVPFHPDESTQLFMSADFEMLFTNPFSLAWTPDQSGDLRAHYRLVDAPITRYALGLSRSLTGKAPLPADWDWSASWEANQQAGAVPEPGLLLGGRIFLTLLFPLNLWLIYQIGARIQGKAAGLLAALFFGLNALVLLHNRRAMAEAALSFGVLAAVWSFFTADRKPWLAGLCAAVAFNAKQTALGLVPLGLIMTSFPAWSLPERKEPRGIQIAAAWFQFLLVFAAVTILLNPFLWKVPLQAAQESWTVRRQLTSRQVADFNHLPPDQNPNPAVNRLAALVANLFIAPPAFAETANYLGQTRLSEQAYLANPAHRLLRGMAAGGVWLGLCLAGMLIGALRLRRIAGIQRKAVLTALLATLFLGATIFFLIPLPWQRYVIPLVPFTCLWPAFAIGAFGEALVKQLRGNRTSSGWNQ